MTATEESTPIRNRMGIHIDIPEEARSEEADQFLEALLTWVSKWEQKHWKRGPWDPFVHAHIKSCGDSDHCYGRGSLGEQEAVKSYLGEDGIKSAINALYEKKMETERYITSTESMLRIEPCCDKEKSRHQIHEESLELLRQRHKIELNTIARLERLQ